MMRLSSTFLQLFVAVSLIVAISYVTIFNSGFFGASEGVLNPPESHLTRCRWQEGDPLIYHLKTKIGVNYDAGHWFHMAENFMVQHSKLREKNLLSNSSNVIYSFDKENFIEDLNGITRLMVYLGTNTPHKRSSTGRVMYSHMREPYPWSAAHATEGSSIIVDHHAFDELQVVDFSAVDAGLDLSDQRFSAVQKYKHWPSAMKFPYLSIHSSPSNSAADASTITSGENGAASIATSTSTTLENLQVSLTSGAPASHSSGETQTCAKYMGTIGGDWPTAQRGHWFPRAGDIQSFRDTLRNACPPESDLLASTKKKRPYKMVIYQRDLSRKLENEEEAVAQLQLELGNDWEIHVLMHETHRSPCVLMHHLHNADILVTPHGFQSMQLMFLPRPALIFEIFPYRYYKRGYGPFGAEYGVIHGGVMSPPTTTMTSMLLPFISTSSCMQSKTCRSFARSQDVRLTKHGVLSLVAFIRQHEVELFGNGVDSPKRDFLYSD